MSAFASVRRPSDGAVLPGPFVYLRGLRILDELEQQGMTVDRSRASAYALGRADWRSSTPMPKHDLDELRTKVLARLQELNGQHRTAARTTASTTPDRGELPGLDIPGKGDSSGLDAGQLDHAGAEVSETPDRNVIIDRDDENEEWKPI